VKHKEGTDWVKTCNSLVIEDFKGKGGGVELMGINLQCMLKLTDIKPMWLFCLYVGTLQLRR